MQATTKMPLQPSVEKWKAQVRDRIMSNLDDMLQDAAEAYQVKIANNANAPTSLLYEYESQYNWDVKNLKHHAEEQLRQEIEREEHERHWASTQNWDTPAGEVTQSLVEEQLAILNNIRSPRDEVHSRGSSRASTGPYAFSERSASTVSTRTSFDANNPKSDGYNTPLTGHNTPYEGMSQQSSPLFMPSQSMKSPGHSDALATEPLDAYQHATPPVDVYSRGSSRAGYDTPPTHTGHNTPYEGSSQRSSPLFMPSQSVQSPGRQSAVAEPLDKYQHAMPPPEAYSRGSSRASTELYAFSEHSPSTVSTHTSFDGNYPKYDGYHSPSKQTGRPRYEDTPLSSQESSPFFMPSQPIVAEEPVDVYHHMSASVAEPQPVLPVKILTEADREALARRERYERQQEEFRERARAILARKQKLRDDKEKPEQWAEDAPSQTQSWSPPASEVSENSPSEKDNGAVLKAEHPMNPQDITNLVTFHLQQWTWMLTQPNIQWADLPWPLLSFSAPRRVEDLTLEAVAEYVIAPLQVRHRSGKALDADVDHVDRAAVKNRLKELLRRWNPDRFEIKYLSRVADEHEREMVREGSALVARILNDLLVKWNDL